MTNTNECILTLLVLFSNLYQLARSSSAEVWILKLTGFWFRSKYPQSVFTRLDVGDSLTELQLSLVYGLKLQVLTSADKVCTKTQEVSCQFNKHGKWCVEVISCPLLPNVWSLKVYNNCLLHLKSNILVFEYVFGSMSHEKGSTQNSDTSLLIFFFFFLKPVCCALLVLHFFYYCLDRSHKILYQGLEIRGEFSCINLSFLRKNKPLQPLVAFHPAFPMKYGATVECLQISLKGDFFKEM